MAEPITTLASAETGADFFQKRASFYLDRSQLEEAINACEHALKIKPDFAPAYKMLGNIRQKQGDIISAIEFYHKALEIQPEYAEVYANFGSLYASQQEWQNAIDSYQKALELAPNLAGVYRNLTKIWTHLGDPEAAANCWEKALNLEPKKATSADHLSLGNLLLSQGKLDRAISCYSHAIQLHPTFIAAYHNLAEALIQQEKWEDAVTIYRQAIRINPTAAIAHHSLAKALVKLGQWSEAIDAFLQSTRLDPDGNWAYYSMMETLVKLGNLLGENKQDQDYLLLYNQLGTHLFKIQRFDEIVTASRQIIENYPNLAAAWSQLANGLNHLGEIDEAIICLQKVGELQNWSNCQEKNYQFTLDYFSHNIPKLQQLLTPLIGQPLNILEVGVYQGMSTCWLLDHILTNSDAKITCIENCFAEYFESNINKTGSENKVTKILDLPLAILPNLEPNIYDLVRIDGRYQPAIALENAVMSWRLLKVNGLIIFDDYQWYAVVDPNRNPKQGIDIFLSIFADQVEILDQGYQLVLRKIGEEVNAKADNLDDLIITYRVYHTLGQLLKQQGKIKEAIEHYQKAIALQPSLAYLQTELGDLFAEDGRLDEAIAAYNRAMRLDPNFPWSYHKLGDVFLTQESWDEAINILRQAITLDPNFSWSYYKLANGLFAKENYLEAVTFYRKAIELNPDFFWSYQKLGDALLNLKQWQEAILVYQQGMKINSDFFWSYERLGDAFVALENWDEAIINYRNALKLNPEYAWSHHKLADVLCIKENWQEAIDSLIQAIKFNPDFVWSYDKLGQAFAKMGNYREAINAYFQADQRQPDLPGIYQKLGENIVNAKLNIQEYREIFDQDQNCLAFCLNLGEYGLNNQQLDLAEIMYQIAGEIDDNNPEIGVKLAEIRKKKLN